MKIIHLILGKARPERMNGVSKVAHNLAQFQALAGHEVAMWGITPTPNEKMPRRAYELYLFGAEKGFAINSELKTAFENEDPQNLIVHFHGGFIPTFYTVSRLLKRLGIAYVFSPHGSLSPFAFRRGWVKKRIYFSLYERKLIRDAHAIHFLGKTQFDAFDNLMRTAHKCLIPNGQNMEELTFAPVSVPRPEAPVFSFCGRLINHYKGLDILLEGFAKYRKEGGEGVLWLIGDGTDREPLTRQAKELNVDGNVVFWGSQYGEEKLNILSTSDAFVHPSRSEGFPTGVLEAAGLGLPCIVSSATNVGEYIDRHQAGVHLQENTPEYISEALHTVSAAKAAGELVATQVAAKKMVETTFSWSQIADQLVSIYQTSN